jgi:hypothetical protein
MKQKLLVITAGTVAAGVGYELLKQIVAHPNSKLNVMVRYLDIATNLSDTYGGAIITNEWKPMQIGRSFIESAAAMNGAADTALKTFFVPRPTAKDRGRRRGRHPLQWSWGSNRESYASRAVD